MKKVHWGKVYNPDIPMFGEIKLLLEQYLNILKLLFYYLIFPKIGFPITVFDVIYTPNFHRMFQLKHRSILLPMPPPRWGLMG